SLIDFGSPNAYLAHLVIPQIEQRTGAKFDYVPVLLGGVFKLTSNRSPAESLAGINAAALQSLRAGHRDRAAALRGANRARSPCLWLAVPGAAQWQDEFGDAVYRRRSAPGRSEIPAAAVRPIFEC